MSEQMNYSPLVANHFAAPRNVGRFEPASDVLVASAGDKDQGAEFVLSARVENDRIVALKHLVYGCPHSIAAASWLTERLAGATRDDLAQWRWRETAAMLDIPPEKWGRLLTLDDAVRALAKGWQARRSTHARTA